MRVRGNISPSTIETTESPLNSNLVELRVRENINKFTEEDSQTGETIEGYEYDEYVFTIPNDETVIESIENNLEDWLTTGRTSEVAPQATLYVTAKSDAIDAYTLDLMEEGIL